jgi:uroporphyrinogen-III synthase
MTGTLLLTRPRDESAALAEVLEEKGWDCFIEPMLEIAPVHARLPDLAGFRALVFTSARGVNAFAAASRHRELTAYTVGPVTASIAINAGFGDVRAGAGDLKALNHMLATEKHDDGRPLLHISGVDVAGTVEAPGTKVERIALYEARTVRELSLGCLERLDRRLFAAVLLFSPRTGHIFADLLRKYARTDAVLSIKALCLSDSVVESVRFLPWLDVQAGPTPDMAGMTALLKRMESV